MRLPRPIFPATPAPEPDPRIVEHLRFLRLKDDLQAEAAAQFDERDDRQQRGTD